MATGKVFILQGVSGSGKSTLAAKLIDGLPMGKQVCVSADNLFINFKTGEYKFDPSLLGKAHQACLRGFTWSLLDEEAGTSADLVVVDNTNTSVVEVAPYYALAESFGYEVTILHVEAEGGIAAAAKRNTHGVPLAGVIAQAERLSLFGESMPPWWNRVKLESFEESGGFEKLAQFKKEVL
jgi:hypothetical protein